MKPLGLGWPNVVSLGRIVLIPVVVLLVSVERPEASWLALVVFLVGALSDLVDGYLARRHAMKTAVGAWLDPLSDKLFVIVPAVALSLLAGGRTRGRSRWGDPSIIQRRGRSRRSPRR